MKLYEEYLLELTPNQLAAGIMGALTLGTVASVAKYRKETKYRRHPNFPKFYNQCKKSCENSMLKKTKGEKGMDDIAEECEDICEKAAERKFK
jgi:hypothetical protein